MPPCSVLVFFFFFFRAPFSAACHSGGRGREGGASLPRRHAAGGRGAIPAAIGQDLVQLRRGIIAVALTCKGQLEQGRCERALGRNGQERRPSRHPGGLSRRSEVRWDGGSSVAQEGGCFRAKAPTHFQGNDDQAAPPGTEELGVRAMSLAPRCCGDRAPRLNVSPRVGLARTCERGDERGVNRELRAVPKGQAVGHDFDAPVICDGHVDVHVGNADVASDTRTGFAANPRNGALKWPCTRGEHAAGSARGTVVPESVEPATTAARAGGEWQGQAQAPQEQNAELRIRNGHGLVRGRDGDGSGRVWPSLRQQQRTGRKGEVRKMRLARALVARSGSLALPSPQGITWLESAAARWRRVRGVKQGSPRRRVVADGAKGIACLIRSGRRGQGHMALQGMEQPVCSFGLQPALRDLQRDLREDLGERVFAYLDDVTLLASPQRV